jgi:geranylgeranyl pyrophosphate synthase
LGKTAGKDAAAGKMTFPALFGIEGSRERAAYWTDEAINSLKPFGSRVEILRSLALMLLGRES